MIAVAARSVASSPTINFVGRTYKGDPTVPSVWDTVNPLLAADKTFSASVEDFNTGNLPYAPNDVAYAQIGMKVLAEDAFGTFDMIVAAKY